MTIATGSQGDYSLGAMSVQRITPDEAARLLQEGWKYVDVRSIPEFEQGHPSGAFNVPFMHQAAHGLAPNADFLAVFAASFGKDEQVIVGCRSGARSLRAAELLGAQGFTSVIDMRGGFMGETGPGGAVSCPGWKSRGLPVATTAEIGRSYDELCAKAR